MYWPLVWLLVAAVSLSSSVFAVPKYISSPPLYDVITTPVGSVKSGVTQVPLITWGADIRTIYANGNARTTAKGSIFDQLGLQLRLIREDVFSKQVEKYMRGESPYLRGTLGMINMVTDLLAKDSRTLPVVIYQLSESAGGDALVVKSAIRKVKHLKGKTIALQAYGPHVDYLTKILTDARLSLADVKIRWLADLTGTDNSPMAAFFTKEIDAVMVIIPDALALTSGGKVGSGSEDSVKGARILLSTKTANRVIADVYAVRSDYLKNNKSKVKKFVRGLFLAQESMEKIVANKASNASEFRKTFKVAAEILLDSAQAVSDSEALYADAEHMNIINNVKFFTNKRYPRNFSKRNKEIQAAFKKIGLIKKPASLTHAKWNYAKMQSGLSNIAKVEEQHFDRQQVAKVVAKKQQQGTLAEGELFKFEVYFKPNQKSFSADLYQDSFARVIDLASTYGGAIITVEGHSDPLGFLRKKKKGTADVVLRRVKQSAKNLSLTRATAVRDNVIGFAKTKGINLDGSQFALIGHGITSPKSGICGTDPCPPKSEQEWRDNMRVEFRIIQVEAEAEVFRPL